MNLINGGSILKKNKKIKEKNNVIPINNRNARSGQLENPPNSESSFDDLEYIEPSFIVMLNDEKVNTDNNSNVTENTSQFTVSVQNAYPKHNYLPCLH